MARVFVITGPSGVGKGTLIRTLLERIPALELSVSATTRRPRPGEMQGVAYHFLSEEEFEQRVQAGEFVEHARYSGQPLRNAALRARGRGSPAGIPSCSRSRSRAPGRSARRCPRRSRSSSRRRARRRCARGSSGAGPTTRSGRGAARDRARGARRAARVRPRRDQRPARGRLGQARGLRPPPPRAERRRGLALAAPAPGAGGAAGVLVEHGGRRVRRSVQTSTVRGAGAGRA